MLSDPQSDFGALCPNGVQERKHFCPLKGYVRIEHHKHMKKQDKQEVRDAFTKRFRQALKRKKIEGSSRAMAEKLGLPHTSFVSLYNAEKLPSRARSIIIAARLGVREEWLMTGIEPVVEVIADGMAALPISHWSKQDQDAILATWNSINSKYTMGEDDE
jgi:hypothetical protein